MPTRQPSVESWQEYLAEAKDAAGKAAFAAIHQRVQDARTRERILRRRGIGGPFDDLNLQDIEKMRLNGEYRALQSVPAFADRVAFLEKEAAEAIEEIHAAEDSALSVAVATAPPRIAKLREQEIERDAFLRGRKLEDLPTSERISFKALVKEQEKVLESIE